MRFGPPNSIFCKTDSFRIFGLDFNLPEIPMATSDLREAHERKPVNTSSSILSSPALSVNTKREVLNRVVLSLQKKFYKPELLTEEWLQSVKLHRPAIEAAATQDEF